MSARAAETKRGRADRAHAGLSCFQIIAHASSFQPLPSFKYLYREEQLYMMVKFAYSRKTLCSFSNIKRIYIQVFVVGLFVIVKYT